MITKERFESIVEWQNATFAGATALSKIAQLKNELDELEYNIMNEAQASFQDTAYKLADCIILLCGVADKLQLDFAAVDKYVEMKMIIDKSRQWGIPDAVGFADRVRIDDNFLSKLSDTIKDSITTVREPMPYDQHLQYLHSALCCMGYNFPIKELDTFLSTHDLVTELKEQTSLRDMAIVKARMEEKYADVDANNRS